jgi:nucleoside-diphosphate-sugar epimerase
MLKDKIVLVTGASRGVGRGVAHELGIAGATVYVTGRSRDGSATTDDLPGTIDEAAASTEQLAQTHSPRFVGRAVVALASDPNVMVRTSRVFFSHGFVEDKDVMFRIYKNQDHSERSWAKRVHVPLLLMFGRREKE